MKTIFQIANQLTGDIWKPEYGNTISDIENAEKRLGIKLPQTLKEFYLAAGNLPQITSSFEYFDKLSELSIEDNKLLFLTENQRKFFYVRFFADVGIIYVIMIYHASIDVVNRIGV